MYDQAVAVVLQDAPAVDLAGAAPPAHRLQPRRAPDRADGARRPGLGDADQRQPRGAGSRGQGVIVRMRRARSARVVLCVVAHAEAASLDQLQAFVRETPDAARRASRRTVFDAQGRQTAAGERRHSSFARPGKFRWNVRQALQAAARRRRRALWIYDPDLNQVTVARADQALGSTPAALLSGARRRRDGVRAGTSSRHKDGLDWLAATPQGARTRRFARIRMGFDSAGLSARWSCSTISARHTVIRFSKLERNPKLDPATLPLHASRRAPMSSGD